MRYLTRQRELLRNISTKSVEKTAVLVEQRDPIFEQSLSDRILSLSLVLTII
jgi:hypothetical protein